MADVGLLGDGLIWAALVLGFEVDAGALGEAGGDGGHFVRLRLDGSPGWG
jgi:hypothetical protein